jgi:GAF domain-containing protein
MEAHMSTNRNELAVGEMASLLTTDYAPVVALERLVAHAVDCVDASLGVLLIADADDTMHVLAAIPDSHVRHADLASSAPAVESARHGSIVLVDDVTDDNRWPRFNESATAAGIRGARAFPLRLEQRALGSLTLYTAEPWGTARNSVTAQTLADLATIVLTQAPAPARQRTSAAQLNAVLAEQAVLDQAAGMLAQSARVSIPAAFQLLLRAARSQRLRPAVLASRITMDPQSLVAIIDVLERP